MLFVEELKSIDISVFRAINSGMVFSFLDASMPIISGAWIWALSALIGICFLGLKYRSRNVFIFTLVLLLCMGLADFFSFQLLKSLAGRLRPCYALDAVRTIQGCGGYFGFPSNHATNAMAAATFVFLVY